MKKFLCYDTNDAASGKIEVDNRGMLKPNSTVPSGSAPYKQLVTDGTGTAKWEDRLAYEASPFVTELLSERTESFSYDDSINVYAANIRGLEFGFIEGQTYLIEFDGEKYNCVAGFKENTTFIGNLAIAGVEPDTGEPFLCIFLPDGLLRLVAMQGTEHRIRISSIVKQIHKLDIKYIPEEAIFSGSYSDLTDKPPEVRLASVSNSGTVKVAFEGTGSPGRNLPVGSYKNVLYLGGLVYRGEGTNSLVLGANIGNTANVASGSASLATGISTTASGLNSLSANDNTIAKGDNSAAFGHSTYAGGKNQFVIGHMNIKDDENKYAFIVGNSDKNILSDQYRSNAHTIDWSGNAWFAGTVEGTAIIVKSSTPDSTKKFKITVDDSGAITATEVTS